MKEYLLVKRVKVEPMTKKEYNDLHGFVSVKNEDSNEVGYLVVSDCDTQWLTKEQFEKYCCETDNLPFGAALEAKKLGKLVKRASWPDDGFFLSASTWRALSWEDFIADDWKIVD